MKQYEPPDFESTPLNQRPAKACYIDWDLGVRVHVYAPYNPVCYCGAREIRSPVEARRGIQFGRGFK